MFETVIGAMMRVRAAFWSEFTRQHPDHAYQRLISAPGVGTLVTITYSSDVDDPGRFDKSRAVGAYFWLTRRNANPAKSYARNAYRGYRPGQSEFLGMRIGDGCHSRDGNRPIFLD